MAPRVNLFNAWTLWMKITGIRSPSIHLPDFLAAFYKYFVLCGSLHYLISMTIVIIDDEHNFPQRSEAALFFLAGFPCAYKLCVFAVRSDELYSLIDRLNDLLEEVEKIYGTDTLTAWQKLCNYIMYFYSTQFICVIIPAFAFSYYKYYFEGVDALPYETYIPFERENNTFFVVLYVISSFLSPTSGLILSNIYFGSLTIAVTGILGKVEEQFSRIDSSNVKTLLKPTVQWHSEVITIIGKSNSLLGTIFVMEYMSAVLYTCFSGYMLIKVGTSDSSASKNIILCIVCIIMPAIYCICGHLIHLKNDSLCDSIFQNDWPSLTPEDRRYLLMPAMLARKGLYLNFRNLIKFDMTTYLMIIKQSYSFLTLLRLMESS